VTLTGPGGVGKSSLAIEAARELVGVLRDGVWLVGLGALGAQLGGAPWKRAALRVVTWSSLAMALTYGIGTIAGPSL